MTKAGWKQIWKWFQIITLGYFIMGGILYFFQEKFIFHPKKLAADYRYQFDVPFREVNLAVNKDKNLSLVQFTLPDSTRKGIVLYFHGNRGNINRYAKHAALFTRNGYEVWMIDYPGFGKSTGKRTENILYEDALVLYKMAIKQTSAEHIIIYGRSIGSGIAAQLASVRDCQQLILETPYYSMAKLAAHYFFIYPVKYFSKYEIPTYTYLEFVRSPVTIFHGTNDGVVPYKHAKWLKEKNGKINLIAIEKGRHNNLAEFPVFREKIDSLLK